MEKRISKIFKLSLTLILFFTVTSAFAQSFVKIVMDQAGTLNDKLAEIQSPVTALKIEGPVNGDDIIVIRSLTGLNTDGTLNNNAVLTHLDMRKAVLTEGGSEYLNGYKVEADRIGTRMFAGSALEWVKLPKNLSIMNEEAFMDCNDLQVVMGLDYYETIGSQAFKNCIKLNDIYLDSATDIQEEAFANCKSLGGIGLNVATLGNGAFRNSGVTFVSIDASNGNNWGNGIFADCENLRNVEILGDKAVLTDKMFAGCTKLQEVIIKGKPETIGNECFNSCTSLFTIRIPSSVSTIGSDAFKNCNSLSMIFVSSGSGINAQNAFDADSIENITLWTTDDSYNAFVNASPWNNMKVMNENDYPMTDKEILVEDFEDYEAQTDEWEGNDIWTTGQGAYVNDIDGNNILQLGDNESYGVISTKALDLSANRGLFYVEMDADGWNELHSAVTIDVKDINGNVIYSKHLTAPQPDMGYSLKHFRVALYGGSEQTIVTLSTTEKERIFIMDNIMIYQTAEAMSEFEASSLQMLDFGRVKLDATANDMFVYIYYNNMDMNPKAKIETASLGAFAVDTEWIGNVGRARVMLATDEVGTYYGFLKIYSDDTNVIKVPLKAIVEDPENVYDLDDSAPVTELAEDFEAAAKIPEGWKNIAVTGDRKWMMRTSGGVFGNRYPAIDALGDVSGEVHALLVLPAMNFKEIKTMGKMLAFDLAVVKPSGATLQLVYLDKNGDTQLIADLTSDYEYAWERKEVGLSMVPDVEAGFLAFEYKGMAHDLATTYRVDNVSIEDISTGISSAAIKGIAIDIIGEEVRIEGIAANTEWAVYNIDGTMVADGKANSESITLRLPYGCYILSVGGKNYKFAL